MVCSVLSVDSAGSNAKLITQTTVALKFALSLLPELPDEARPPQALQKTELRTATIGEPEFLSTAPKNMEAFRGQNGKVYTFDVTGTSDISKLWGSDIYTDDSTISDAAVHFGIVKPGETKRVNVVIEPALARYQSTTRNGLTSQSYESWKGSYRFIRNSPKISSSPSPKPSVDRTPSPAAASASSEEKKTEDPRKTLYLSKPNLLNDITSALLPVVSSVLNGNVQSDLPSGLLVQLKSLCESCAVQLAAVAGDRLEDLVKKLPLGGVISSLLTTIARLNEEEEEEGEEEIDNSSTISLNKESQPSLSLFSPPPKPSTPVFAQIAAAKASSKAQTIYISQSDEKRAFQGLFLLNLLLSKGIGEAIAPSLHRDGVTMGMIKASKIFIQYEEEVAERKAQQELELSRKPTETEDEPMVATPTVGLRVKRGKDWKWKDQDQNGLGTVSKILENQWVKVTWDHGQTFSYRWQEGARDLAIVGTSSTSSPAPAASSSVAAESAAAAAAAVSVSSQSEVTTPALASPSTPNGADSPKPRVRRTILSGLLQPGPGLKPIVGMRVRKGKDWKWKDQDHGGEGSVLQDTNDGWVKVKWDHGETNSYRWGAEDCFDLGIVGADGSLPAIYKSIHELISANKSFFTTPGEQEFKRLTELCISMNNILKKKMVPSQEYDPILYEMFFILAHGTLIPKDIVKSGVLSSLFEFFSKARGYSPESPEASSIIESRISSFFRVFSEQKVDQKPLSIRTIVLRLLDVLAKIEQFFPIALLAGPSEKLKGESERNEAQRSASRNLEQMLKQQISVQFARDPDERVLGCIDKSITFSLDVNASIDSSSIKTWLWSVLPSPAFENILQAEEIQHIKSLVDKYQNFRKSLPEGVSSCPEMEKILDEIDSFAKDDSTRSQGPERIELSLFGVPIPEKGRFVDVMLKAMKEGKSFPLNGQSDSQKNFIKLLPPFLSTEPQKRRGLIRFSPANVTATPSPSVYDMWNPDWLRACVENAKSVGHSHPLQSLWDVNYVITYKLKNSIERESVPISLPQFGTPLACSLLFNPLRYPCPLSCRSSCSSASLFGETSTSSSTTSSSSTSLSGSEGARNILPKDFSSFHAMVNPNLTLSGAHPDHEPFAAPQVSNILGLLWCLHEIFFGKHSREQWAQLLGIRESDFQSDHLRRCTTNQILDKPAIVMDGPAPWFSSVMRHYSFLVTPALRYRLLEVIAGIEKPPELPPIALRSGREPDPVPIVRLTAHRDRILSSAVSATECLIQGPLEMTFEGEEGVGMAPTLEFYTLLSEELTNSRYGLWVGMSLLSDSKYSELLREIIDHSPVEKDSSSHPEGFNPPGGLFPMPSYWGDSNKDKLSFSKIAFKTLGYFVAKAYCDKRLMSLPLSSTLFRWLLGYPLGIYEIYQVYPPLGRLLLNLSAFARKRTREALSIKQLEEKASIWSQELGDHSSRVDETGFTFTMLLPGCDDWELKPGGTDIQLTSDNVMEYVELTVKHFFAGVAPQLHAFKQGFELVISCSSLSRSGLGESDLCSTLCGEDGVEWDEKKLREVIKCGSGYQSECQTIIDLMSVLCEFDSSHRRLFVKFLTASPRLPIGGVAALTPPFTVAERTETSTGAGKIDSQLPSAMCCKHLLKLPRYSSKEVLCAQITKAVEEGQGEFGLD
eukprot:TRINITY_DN1436_c1_g1_i4.p1 TRINITY_DN1436_c1_g1~~TRINITY_DN1436_c1_g1_i4.p1  ORF type:complete len:1935 (+),score=580.20 TRINITY_DN1436_c1_g1_i4:845-5806(+)